MTLAVSVLIGAGQMMAGGFFLGIGYWSAGLITKRIDEKLFLYDKRQIKKLEKEMDLQS